jgi:hypothetical protein
MYRKGTHDQGHVSMSSLFAMTGYAISITSVPYTISTSGNYKLTKNLTYTGSSNAITVSASNVVLNLNGFTLSGTGSSKTSIAIYDDGFSSVTLQNGTITGFAAALDCANASQILVQNLTMFNNELGIDLNSCSYCAVQNCVMVGVGESVGGVGVVLNSTVANCVVKNCTISNSENGCNDSGGPNLFIASQITNCGVGLNLSSSTGDKYEAVVTAGCATPFSGGTAVGTENN